MDIVEHCTHSAHCAVPTPCTPPQLGFITVVVTVTTVITIIIIITTTIRS